MCFEPSGNRSFIFDPAGANSVENVAVSGLQNVHAVRLLRFRKIVCCQNVKVREHLFSPGNLDGNVVAHDI